MMADGAQEQIPLQTNKGLIGYKIIKFEMMPTEPGIKDYESVIQIFKTEQTTITADIDFSNNRLLAAGFYQGTGNVNYTNYFTTIFDSEVFNQDIFVTHKDRQANYMNYYIELEQMDLAMDEATVATLKDIRNND